MLRPAAQTAARQRVPPEAARLQMAVAEFSLRWVQPRSALAGDDVQVWPSSSSGKAQAVCEETVEVRPWCQSLLKDNHALGILLSRSQGENHVTAKMFQGRHALQEHGVAPVEALSELRPGDDAAGH